MSWYVRKLLMNSEVIRSSIETKHFDINGHLGLEELSYYLYDYDTDSYDDLISVEMCVAKLIDKNLFSDSEKIIIKHLLSGLRIPEIEEAENLSRPTVVKRIMEVANRIAYNLGYHFTDHGFLELISNKYNLGDAQREKLEKIIKEET